MSDSYIFLWHQNKNTNQGAHYRCRYIGISGLSREYSKLVIVFGVCDVAETLYQGSQYSILVDL